MTNCPKCGSSDSVPLIGTYFNSSSYWHSTCKKCGFEFEDKDYMD